MLLFITIVVQYMKGELESYTLKRSSTKSFQICVENILMNEIFYLFPFSFPISILIYYFKLCCLQ